MGRKTRITKEMILEAAYELLDKEGMGAVQIKTIAAKLGCSTQPVSWQFGSMTELKKELFLYSRYKLYAPFAEKTKGKAALEAFFISGLCYISNACDHPNVFRFVCVDDPVNTIGEALHEGSIFESQFDANSARALAEEYKISPDVIGSAVRDVVIYTHGLSVMMMFDSYKLPKKQACEMVYNTGVTILKTVGVETKKDYKYLIKEYE